jgi:undecaprenyl-diphosphatase
MDSIQWFEAVILGIVEGLTEFLPVSSTGHLIIVGDLLGFTGEVSKTFEIFIQLGSILGVVWLYRVKIWNLVSKLDERPAQRFLLNLAIGFLPAAVIGYLLHGHIKAYLFNPVTVAAALIVGGFIILLIERRDHREGVPSLDAIRPMHALKVGFAQTVAMFPGVSRAGATIMGGLLVGLSRTTATEFSFFLAMPTMLAATTYDLYKTYPLLRFDDAVMLATGFITAFVTAVIVVKTLLVYVSRHDFTVFGYYRIVFGLLVLLYYW